MVHNPEELPQKPPADITQRTTLVLSGEAMTQERTETIQQRDNSSSDSVERLRRLTDEQTDTSPATPEQ